ncbi:acrosomal protein KIAA1210 homolog isoform X2 [Bombina bombina]|nr:acrosomal protein KIAA1210 homolog isoform X2 [Bombina bombina]XP_053555150.1 acrosomal protein KIAA1210 homolog isoform X2 [Bombina bombina]
MAANSADGTQTSENEEAHEDHPVAGKKKSKFQAFKKLFVKKKRKAAPAPSSENNLKPSQSSTDISVPGTCAEAFHSGEETGTKGNMGNKAVSHDSIFISEPEKVTEMQTSQENIHSKVKALQLQIQQNIRIGSTPQKIVPKKQEDSGALSEDDGLPRSPPEITSLHDVIAQTSNTLSNPAERRNSLSLGGTDSEEEQISSEPSSRPISPFPSNLTPCLTSPASSLLLVDFTTPARSSICLDNSAAKHKIAVKPKKHRGPMSKVKQNPENEPKRSHPECELRLSFEQEKHTDESVVEVSEFDVTPLQIASAAEFKECAEDRAVPGICVTVCTEDSSLSAEEEAPLSICEVELHNISSEDMDNNGEDPQPHEKNNSLPSYEQTLAAETIDNSNSEDICEDAQNLKVKDNSDLDVGLVNIYTENQKITSLEITVGDKILSHESKDECHEELVRCIPEGEDNLAESSVNVTELSATSDDLLEAIMTVVLSNNNSVTGTDKEATGSVVTDDDVVNESREIPTETDTLPSVQNAEPLITVNVSEKSNLYEQLPLQPETEDTPIESDTILRSQKEEEPSVKRNRDNLCQVNSQSGSLSREEQILVKTDAHKERCDVIKPAILNPETIQKSSTKPVRFTVAPAWQRSLSSEAKAKDVGFERSNRVNTLKPELFGGVVNPKEPVIASNIQEQNKSEKPTEISVDEPSNKPFGIRLRSTSTPLKYSDEHFSESIKTSSLFVGVISPTHTQNVTNPIKPSHTPPDNTPVSKPLHEEKNLSKANETKSQDHSQHTEPAWISMAKLKQRVFQDHPLAKEQSPEGKEIDQHGKDIGECSQKISIESTLQSSASRTDKELSVVSQATVLDTPVDHEKSVSSTAPENPNEPPWLSLAKQKAKAWSEMPQIVH